MPPSHQIFMPNSSKPGIKMMCVFSLKIYLFISISSLFLWKKRRILCRGSYHSYYFYFSQLECSLHPPGEERRERKCEWDLVVVTNARVKSRFNFSQLDSWRMPPVISLFGSSKETSIIPTYSAFPHYTVSDSRTWMIGQGLLNTAHIHSLSQIPPTFLTVQIHGPGILLCNLNQAIPHNLKHHIRWHNPLNIERSLLSLPSSSLSFLG